MIMKIVSCNWIYFGMIKYLCRNFLISLIPLSDLMATLVLRRVKDPLHPKFIHSFIPPPTYILLSSLFYYRVNNWCLLL